VSTAPAPIAAVPSQLTLVAAAPAPMKSFATRPTESVFGTSAASTLGDAFGSVSSSFASGSATTAAGLSQCTFT
jgi:hypothetical protein